MTVRAPRRKLVRRIALMGAGLLLLFPAAVAPQPAGNLVQNHDAEAGGASPDGNVVVAIPSWTTTSNFTVVQYGAPGFPDAADSAAIAGGRNFFAGGPNTPLATATQVIGVAEYFREIDAGNLVATLSGFIGGAGIEEDNGAVEAGFINGFGIKLGNVKIGPVTAADRGSDTKLLQRSASAPIPAGTRNIRVVMTATRLAGTYNNAFFDNLSVTVATAGPAGRLTYLGCVSRTGTGGACAVRAQLDGASHVAISADGFHLYVSSYISDAVLLFDRSPVTGALTWRAGTCWSKSGSGGCRRSKALNGARGLALAPGGRNVYVASVKSDGVAVFRRNAVGRLTQLEGKKACVTTTGSSGHCTDGRALNGAKSVAVSPLGRNVYVAAEQSDALVLFARSDDGSLTQLRGRKGCIRAWGNPNTRGRSGNCHFSRWIGTVESLAVSPQGDSVYLGDFAGFNAYRRATSSGELAFVGGLPARQGDYQRGLRWLTEGVAVSPDAKNLYVAGGGIAVFRRVGSVNFPSPLAGSLACVGPVSLACSGGPAADLVAVSPDNKSVYGAFWREDPQYQVALQVYSREQGTGALTPISASGGCFTGKVRTYPGCEILDALAKPSGIALSPDSKYLYVTAFNGDAILVFRRH